MSDFIASYTNLQHKIKQLALKNHTHPACLIAVSKHFPITSIQAAYDAGQRDFGENYIQEWSDKWRQLPDDIVWHIIGNIQSNKTKEVAQRADWVHSISRLKIAQRLSDQRPSHLAPLNICIEINIAKEPQRHGIAPEELLDLASSVASLPNLKLRGLMCVASDADHEMVAKQMQQMQQLFLQYQNRFHWDTLSMGMSSDWEIAMAYGATHIRIGSALFGQRIYQ